MDSLKSSAAGCAVNHIGNCKQRFLGRKANSKSHISNLTTAVLAYKCDGDDGDRSIACRHNNVSAAPSTALYLQNVRLTLS